MRNLQFLRNLSKKYGKELLGTATKTGVNVSKKITYKAAEASAEFKGKKLLTQ